MDKASFFSLLDHCTSFPDNNFEKKAGPRTIRPMYCKFLEESATCPVSCRKSGVLLFHSLFNAPELTSRSTQIRLDSLNPPPTDVPQLSNVREIGLPRNGRRQQFIRTPYDRGSPVPVSV